MKQFDLTIVTPERVTYEGKATYLSLPAWEGSWGVLAGHVSALVLLREGLVVIQADKRAELLSISGGFAEISPHKTVLFAETAELASELDLERTQLAAQRAKETIAQARQKKIKPEELDIEVAQAALRRALVRLKVSEDYKRRKPQPYPTTEF